MGLVHGAKAEKPECALHPAGDVYPVSGPHPRLLTHAPLSGTQGRQRHGHPCTGEENAGRSAPEKPLRLEKQHSGQKQPGFNPQVRARVSTELDLTQKPRTPRGPSPWLSNQTGLLSWPSQVLPVPCCPIQDQPPPVGPTKQN